MIGRKGANSNEKDPGHRTGQLRQTEKVSCVCCKGAFMPAPRALPQRKGAEMEKNHTESDITENIRKGLIKRLTDELVPLRTKLGLSQNELSSLVGISRQTYSMLETGKRVMSWGTYLSLILIFDNNEQTHDIIRDAGIFPDMLFGGSGRDENREILFGEIRNKLDEQALHAIETVIMLEYARCSRLSGDAVIRAFDGYRLRMRRNPEPDLSAGAEPDLARAPQAAPEQSVNE